MPSIRLLTAPTMLLCALLVACQGGLALFEPMPTATPPPPAAETAAMEFLKAWEQADFSTMYGLLAPNDRSWLSEEQFTATYSEAAEVMTLKRITTTLRSVLEEERAAQAEFAVTFDTTLVGSFQVTNTLPLRLSDGRWDVQWTRNCILPQWVEGSISTCSLRNL